MWPMTETLGRRLRLWLWLMSRCEDVGLSDTPLYYWLVRRAASCHRWRTP